MTQPTSDIETYYQSLRQVRERIIDERTTPAPFLHRLSEAAAVITLVLFFLSLIPVLPFSLMLIGSWLGWKVGPIDFREASWGDAAIIYVIAVGAFTLIGVTIGFASEKLVPRQPSRLGLTMSKEQIAFLGAYEAAKELKYYFVSHIDQHVTNATDKLLLIIREPARSRRRIARAEGTFDVHRELPERPSKRIPEMTDTSSLSYQRVAAEDFLRFFGHDSWLVIDPNTKAALDAIVAFPDKVVHRLDARQDLPIVLAIVDSLSIVLYAFLPEHRTHMEDAKLQQLHSTGSNALTIFIQEVNALTHFQSSDSVGADVRGTKRNIVTLLSQTGYIQVMLRFSLWFAVLLLLTSGAVYLLGNWFPLSADAIATLVIGGSIAGAAALASLVPQRPSPK